MKKGFIVIFIIAIGVSIPLVMKIIDNKKMEEIKNGWHVEIENDYVNVRVEPDEYSLLFPEKKKVLKGEIYKVKDINLDDKVYYWYFVELEDGVDAWIANPRKGGYLKDFNNPNDIASPTIKFKDSVYYVDSIEDINYDHLILWDDKGEYTMKHILYHEVKEYDNIDQYWIKYTITDKVGKETSKMQKIEFKETPDESQVEDF